MLNENYKTVGGDRHVEAALVGRDSGAAITHVLATIDGGVAVENLFPASVRYGQHILFDYVTICIGSIVKACYDDDFLVSAPALESKDSIDVTLVEDVDVVAADRTQSSAERNELLIKAKELLAVPDPLTEYVFAV